MPKRKDVSSASLPDQEAEAIQPVDVLESILIRNGCRENPPESEED
jgi:hypothetical protein